MALGQQFIAVLLKELKNSGHRVDRTKLVGDLVNLILFLRNVNSSNQQEVVMHINFFIRLYEVLFVEWKNKHGGKKCSQKLPWLHLQCG